MYANYATIVRILRANGANSSHSVQMSDGTEIRIRLKTLRKRSGLSIRRVAESLEIAPSTYSHYESRYKRPFLPQDLVSKLADLFSKHGIKHSETLALARESAPEFIETAAVAGQIAEIVRLFLAIENPHIRNSRYKMLQAVLATDQESGALTNFPDPSDPTRHT